MYRISQSVAKRVSFKAFLASDGKTPATGKTIAITISKNGAAFANPNAGATNATEIASGWYYVDLDTTDTGTVGPLIVRGTEGTIDDVGRDFSVEGPIPANVTQFGGSNLTAAGGIPEVKVASLANNAITAASIASAALTEAKFGTLTEPSGPPSFPLTPYTAWAWAAFFSGIPINERVQYQDPAKQDLKNQAGSVIAKKDIGLVSGVSITHEKVEAP